MREIEIKLRVSDLDALEKKLVESGLVISKEIKQHDVIYSNTGKDIYTLAGKKHTVMRIRDEDGKLKLTLKQDVTSELDCIEYETEFNDREVMHDILLTLGWEPQVEVKKIRKNGKIGEYEICLDNVEGLGTFVELEKMVGDDADLGKVREELFRELEKFGLSRNDEETKGYDTQLYQLKK